MASDFDLNSAIEELAEKERPRKPWKFKFDGREYTLPPKMDIRAVAAIANGRLDDGLRLLLNPEQWEALQASPTVLDGDGLKALFDEYGRYTNGETLGESAASTDSSKSTGRPSKRTSNASTKSTSLRSVKRR